MLHCWSQGEIRDDQFQQLVKRKLEPLDGELARLVYVLFKKNISLKKHILSVYVLIH
jgi:hypothetical protein